MVMDVIDGETTEFETLKGAQTYFNKMKQNGETFDVETDLLLFEFIDSFYNQGSE